MADTQGETLGETCGDTQGAWIWYELMTTDADGAKAFYEAVVPGWTLQTSHGGGDSGAEAGDTAYGFITNSDGGMTGGILPLTKEMCDGGARSCWLGYICVDDVDAMLTAIEAAGGKTVMPPRDVEMAGRIAMASDPGGAHFYIMKPKPKPMPMPGMENTESTAFSSTLAGRCAWNELAVTGQQKAIEFYTSLFGWNTDGMPPMDMGEMGQYIFINKGELGLGAIMERPKEMPVSAWSHYFRVPSIEAAKAAVETNGGTVMMGPHEVPGDEWIITGTDPQGAYYALVGGK